MNRSKLNVLSKVQKQRLFVMCAILFGAAIRLLPLLTTDPNLPSRSGGLFVEFSQQISAHSYLMPDRIPYYSDGGIPFAYPPLPFYFVAVLLDLLPLTEFAVANSIPPIIGIIALPFFYSLTGKIKLPFPARFAALIVYAAIPALFKEVIESAGLAEAFGGLAIILLASTLLDMDVKNTLHTSLLISIAWAACILSSPGSAYASVLMVPVLFFSMQYKKPPPRMSPWKILARLTAIGLFSLILSSPYWLSVIKNHGADLIARTFAAQHGDSWAWLINGIRSLIRFNISKSQFNVLYDGIILAGLGWAFCHRCWELIYLLIAFFLIPREGGWLVSLPASILAGISIAEIHRILIRYRGQIGRLISLVLFTLLVSMNAIWEFAIFHSERSTGNWSEAVSAATWIRENIPEDAHLIVISDHEVREWIPHLSRRTVLNVWQGLEWKPEDQKIVKDLNSSLDRCQDVECIHAHVVQAIGYGSYYIYIDMDQLAEFSTSSDKSTFVFDPLWENDKVIIAYLFEP